MIHQSGFSWNTRGITIYSFSDVTTMIHQTKYQLYLFIFAQHFTVIYIFIQNQTQPSHICLYIPLASNWTKHIFSLHPKNPPSTSHLPSPPSRLPRRWHGKGRTARAQDDAQHIQHTQQLRGEPLRAGAGGSGGRCPRCSKRWWQKNVVGKHMLDSDLVRIRWFRWFKNWFWYYFLETHLFFENFIKHPVGWFLGSQIG